MSWRAALILPLARSYAEHVGLPAPKAELEAELERRLAGAGLLSSALMVLGAAYVRWAAPVALLGRLRGFSGLSAQDRESLLSRLQCSQAAVPRGLFMGIKPLLLALCYGRGRFLESIGARG